MDKEKILLDALNTFGNFTSVEQEFNYNQLEVIYEAMNQVLHIASVRDWVAATNALPKPLQTVWITNGKGWCSLGCLVESDEGWHWAESNGVIYVENGEIVSECESDDLDVNYWHELPKLPFFKKHLN